MAQHSVDERDTAGPCRHIEDLIRRVPDLSAGQLEAPATAGAFGRLGLERRKALWIAGAVAGTSDARLAGIVTGTQSPDLPGMTPADEAAADLWAAGISPDGHPTQFVRHHLHELGAVAATDLHQLVDGARVLVGGVVTHRQRPATAGGTMFVNLEDETGLSSVSR